MDELHIFYILLKDVEIEVKVDDVTIGDRKIFHKTLDLLKVILKVLFCSSFI